MIVPPPTERSRIIYQRPAKPRYPNLRKYKTYPSSGLPSGYTKPLLDFSLPESPNPRIDKTIWRLVQVGSSYKYYRAPIVSLEEWLKNQEGKKSFIGFDEEIKLIDIPNFLSMHEAAEYSNKLRCIVNEKLNPENNNTNTLADLEALINSSTEESKQIQKPPEYSVAELRELAGMAYSALKSLESYFSEGWDDFMKSFSLVSQFLGVLTQPYGHTYQEKYGERSDLEKAALTRIANELTHLYIVAKKRSRS
ncbi:MAG: hypothetical protein SFT81_04885 [Candidatus Caenarcaniphilales bacterium]|nr:hypothetical protein [Candidatus Caenarcaniphilales bacterium]